MAQYESLKDYLSLNRKDEILKKVNEYIQADSNVESNCFLKDFTIITVRCVEEIFPTATVFMDVSAEVYNNNNTSVSSVYYSISFSGNVLTGFSDLNFISAGEISEKELHEENIHTMFGLPDITCDTLEEEAQKIHRILCAIIKKDPEHKYWFPVIEIKEKYKLKMWPAKLDDGVLGQIRFTPSRADIYDIRDMNKCFTDELIPANAILINSDYYNNHSTRYDDIIVAAHELVHWNLHRMYFYISQLLDDNYQLMNCSSKPIVFDDSMSLKDRAYWYAEWQANELAIRVAMPKHLVEKAIEEYNNDESVHNPTDIPFSGRYYQNMIYKLSWDFNVPEETVKKRLRQLGYDYADGTFVTVDDCTYKPFTFTQGTLKENETFVIDRENYERLLRENKDFAELIKSGRYVYLGYVVCLFDNKFINIEEKGESIELILSEYARENAQKCLLKFQCKMRSVSKQPYYYNVFYLNKIPDYNETVYDEFKLSEEDTGLDSKTISDIKEYNEILTELHSSKAKESLANTVIYYMKRKPIHDNVLYKKAGLTLPALRKIYKGETKKPEMRTIMGLCIGLELDNEECYDMFEKAGYNVREDTMRNRAYRFLFGCTESGLKECNKILRYFNQKELPIHK